jgi:SAM-dependent methyltransferase
MSTEYEHFPFPLNVFLHILLREEGAVEAMHYGLFAAEDEPIAVAQRRSTDLLRSRLPAPRASVLEVGIGLGHTLAELASAGYQAFGITPDEKQLAVARRNHGEINAACTPLEAFDSGGVSYDAVIFQESSQYIDSDVLWRRMSQFARDRVIVIDEFRTADDGTLHALLPFLNAARLQGFRKLEDLDLTEQAIPTVDYFIARLPRYRDRLVRDLDVTSEQIDALIESGHGYRSYYASGAYTYRLLTFSRE